MKNTIILDKQNVYYLVLEGVDEPGAHSLWSNKIDAENMVSILNLDQYSTAYCIEIYIDKEMPERSGYEVLVNINTGKQVEDEFIGHDHRCVYLASEEKAVAHNFYIPNDDEEILHDGDIPRKIKGKWVVNDKINLNWNDVLRIPGYEKQLIECYVSGIGETKEEALKEAKQFAEEIKRTLEEQT